MKTTKNEKYTLENGDGTVKYIKKTNKKIVKQGAISDAIWNSKFLKEYVAGYPCGYVGSFNRSKMTDTILIDAFASKGISDDMIAEWLTSTTGRHLMDDTKDSSKAFEKRVKEYTSCAATDVLIWGREHHDGSLAGREKLMKIIEAAALELGYTKK